MASTESARLLIEDARAMVFILMQEGDSERGFVNSYWADEMYQATELLKQALASIDRAESYV